MTAVASSGAATGSGATMSPLGAAAGNAGGNLLSSVFNQIFYKRNLQYQNEINRSNWEIQNEYNLPKNQLQRYLDAGMSPGAAMQAVAGIENSAGSLQSPQSPMPSANLDPLGGYMAGKNFNLQQRIGEANAEKAEADAEKARAEANQIDKLTPEMVKKIRAEVDESVSRKNLNEVNKDILDISLKYAEDMTKEQLNNLRLQGKELQASINLMREQSKSEKAKRSLMRTEMNVNQAMAERIDADTKNIVENTKTQQYINAKHEFDKFVRDQLHRDPTEDIFTQYWQALAHGDDEAQDVFDALMKFADDGIDAIEHEAYAHPWLTAAAAAYGLRQYQGESLDRLGKVLNLALPFFSPGAAISKAAFGRGFGRRTYNLGF